MPYENASEKNTWPILRLNGSGSNSKSTIDYGTLVSLIDSKVRAAEEHHWERAVLRTFRGIALGQVTGTLPCRVYRILYDFQAYNSTHV
jgi:hypothetical protein